MARGTSVKLVFNHLPALANRLPAKAGKVVQESLDRVVEGAKQRSRVDTGAMKEGWRKETAGGLSGTVTNDTPETIFNEFGTSHMAAQPMLGPSIADERPRFLKQMREITEL